MDTKNSVDAQCNMHPIPCNPGTDQPGQTTPGLTWWEAARFQAVSSAQTSSVKSALSHPTYVPLPQAIRQLARMESTR